MRFLVAVLAMLSLFNIFAGESLAKEVQVKGYTKKNGTVVKPHTMTIKDKPTAATAKAVDDSKQEVKGYTRKDGTVVKGYTRSKPKAKP